MCPQPRPVARPRWVFRLRGEPLIAVKQAAAVSSAEAPHILPTWAAGVQD
ncbi:hypothetical protein GCM10017687_81120 [Streptomyces echinatus]